MNNSLSYKKIWKVAFPIMLGSVAQNIVNVTDTAFLGQLDHIALGAAGNSIILYFVLTITGMGLTTGAQIIIGRRNGEQNYEQIGTLHQQTFYFIVPLALVLISVMYFLSPVIMQALTQSDNIYAAAMEFLNYRIFGLFFVFINFTFIAFFVGTTNTKVMTYANIIMMVVNVILDYGFIFGNLGLPQLGIKGAAIASVIAEASATVFLIGYTYFKVDLEKYQLFRFTKFDFSVLKRVLKVGSPIMMQNFMALSSWFAFFMIIEKMGEMELAASHIARSIYMVLMIPIFGFSQATNTLVSNLIGEGHQDKVMKMIVMSMTLGLLATLSVMLITVFFPTQIIGFYTFDPVLTKMVLDVLKVIDVAMFMFCISFIMFSGVTGSGNTVVSMFIEFFTISIYLVATYLMVIEYHCNLQTAWFSEFIYFIILGIFSFLYLKFGGWRKNKSWI